ncbi:hypothetical protein HK44_020420 [Pseudomonas fluorescens HK44]|uniref:DUF1566 domain-containing protein n=1 Tax=Pseudomonas fluorescens HK44 TaxID=1042209 RepID=A0A010TF27_PSEFL|nr:hypothetical protein [Pseudomonas fluorescens]EXF95767.1 hypothetical protein HK44_020420 [Pseudomonas fluorescens HK44]
MQLITVNHGATTLTTPCAALALQVLTGLVGAAPANTQATDFIPALGDYWPGQGGVNGGPVPAREGAPFHYLILATEDVGEHAWGGRGIESGATSKWDGMRNTEQLVSEGDRPAANAAAKYTADGHHDFFLGSPADMHQVWVNGLITKGAYWTSTQRSADFAFTMVFGGGYSYYGGVKVNELRVRPVRRLFIR